MAAQDGLQASGTPSATTSGLIISYGIRATSVKIINDGGSAASVDVTQGTLALASTSASYLLKANETLILPLSGNPQYPAFYTGFTAITTGGGSATLRYLALR